jgi:glycine cleavage system H protein
MSAPNEENPKGVVKDLGSGLSYARCKFSTTLPKTYRYTAGHFWLTAPEPGLWRIGFTKFAVRMLGDFVELNLNVKPDTAIAVADELGTFEGLKAVTTLFAVADGQFVRANPALDEKPELLRDDPYRQGWLYEVRGTPDPRSVGVTGYIEILDAVIDEIQKDKD